MIPQRRDIQQPSSIRRWYVGVLLLPIPTFLLAMYVGNFTTEHFSDYWLVVQSWFGLYHIPPTDNHLRILSEILYRIRLPRVLLAFLSGASLCTAGTILQGIFKNPLVDSYTLGISSGAAFGVSVAVMAGLPVHIFAFVFGISSVGITYSVAISRVKSSTVTVVLAGVVVAGVFTALLSIIQFFINPYKLQSIVQWTMGNMNAASWAELKRVYLPVLICLTVIYVIRWRLNILAMGDEAIRAVGGSPLRDKLVLVTCASIITSTIVAVIGVVSMFGLLVPHMIRMKFGADNRKAIPISMIFGGTFFVLIDTCSRSLFTFEIPIGIVTVLLGSPFFIYLMRRQHLNWQ